MINEKEVTNEAMGIYKSKKDKNMGKRKKTNNILWKVHRKVKSQHH